MKRTSVTILLFLATLFALVVYIQPTWAKPQPQLLKVNYEDLNKNARQQVDCLAQNMYFESGWEPEAGQIAVAMVTLNRLESGRYANTICGVVKQKIADTCQFSWVCAPKKPITMPVQWKESREIAESILISQKKYSTIRGAMFFHADYVKPAWASTKDFVQQIGRHLFYKD